jgi:putative transposase
MSDDPDFGYLIVDSTIVRAHQHPAGAKKGGLKIRRSALARWPEHQDTYDRSWLGMSCAVHAYRRRAMHRKPLH